MSVNKYNQTTGQLEPLSQNRIWVGTEAEYNAAATAGTIGTDMLVYITDDEQGPTNLIEANNKYAVQSGTVYNAFVNANSTLKDNSAIQGSYKPITSAAVYNLLNRCVYTTRMYGFTASAATTDFNKSVYSSLPSNAIVLGAVIIQRTAAGTTGIATYNSASGAIVCTNLTVGKEYGVRLLYTLIDN